MTVVHLQEKLKQALHSIGIHQFAGAFCAGDEILLACRMRPELALEGLITIQKDIEANGKKELQEIR